MHLYSAGGAQSLAVRLGEVLADPPTDPFAADWLAVPSDGMRRWLTLELARHLGQSGADDGIVANVQRAYPGTLRTALLAAERDEEEEDPWAIERMVWSLLEVIEGLADDPVPAALRAPGEVGSGYGRARRAADLFDRYHLHRPDMIRSWAAGDDVDGSGRGLSSYAVWQPRLWRFVRGRIGEPSPPERLPGLIERVADGGLPLELPDRLMLFGFTLISGGEFLDIARAVGEQREVHLFVLEPSHLNPAELLASAPGPVGESGRARGSDPAIGLVHHPLLRSWGRLARETALLLADGQGRGMPAPLRVDDPVDGPAPDTLLSQLQCDIRNNQAPTASLRVHPNDRSVQFHACYGATRQVETVRNALLHLLATPGGDLSEDDIVVLCPDLDRFAPLIEAVFGPSAHSTATESTSTSASASTPSSPAEENRSGVPSLRYRIADQSMKSANPILSSTVALLDLVAGRFEATSVLGFVAQEPVRARFGFDEDDLATMAEWIGETNVRWGLDGEHRTRFGIPESLVTNTWQAALDRLLIGSSTIDDELVLAIGHTAPYGVEGSDVDVLGHLAEVLSHLGTLARETTTARPLAAWVELVRAAVGALFATPPDSQWQQEALDRLLSSIVAAASTEGVPSPVLLYFDDVRRLFEERLTSGVGRPDFFRGGITVTSMTPLRGVPFRVVCLLGMDQSAFGSPGVASDDLTAVHPRLGDRDPRGEGRESLLEAVLAAEETLLVVRDGYDVRTNQPVPRSVVNAELFEAVMATVSPVDGDQVAARLELSHPRQAFDERSFEAGRYVDGGAWSFDRDELEGALSWRSRAHAVPAIGAEPLEPAGSSVIDLADLHEFLANPPAAFFTQRLQTRIPRAQETPDGALPVSVTGLDGWRVGSRLMEARLSGLTTERWATVERALGTLPAGSLGDREIERGDDEVNALIDAARSRGLRPGPGEPYAIDVELPDGTRLVGSVLLRLDPSTPGPVRVNYSRTKPTHRVAAWLDLMALLVADPSTGWRSLAISRPAKSGDVVVNDLIASDADGSITATTALEVAVDCYRRGMCEPIPLFPSFSHQVYRGYARVGDWSGYQLANKDGDHPATKLAFGGATFHEMMELPALPSDPRGPKGRVFRFATYLHRAIDKSTKANPSASAGKGSGPKS
jgi:exodeoxyribonuclease V gamma subunit